MQAEVYGSVGELAVFETDLKSAFMFFRQRCRLDELILDQEENPDCVCETWRFILIVS